MPHHFEVVPAVEGTSLNDLWGEFDKVMLAGGEGLVIKNPYGEYLPGERPRHWVKIKPNRVAELQGTPFKCVVVGANRGEGTKAGRMSSYRQAMCQRFKMVDEGLCTFYLGMNMEQTDDGVLLHQAHYIDTCIKRFGLEKLPSRRTPLPPDVRICAVAKADDRKDFLTCINVRQARERRAGRGRSEARRRPQSSWTRWHTS